MSATQLHEAVDPSGSCGWLVTTPSGIFGFIDVPHSELRVLTDDAKDYAVGVAVAMTDLAPPVRRLVHALSRTAAFRPMD